MKTIRLAVAALLALGALYLIAGQSTGQPMGHDEDQFVASGLLTAEKGLLPWRDYPLFHTPYQVLLTGWLAFHTGEPFYVMRVLPAVSAWLMLLLLAGQSWRWMGQTSWLPKTATVLAICLLVLFSPVFYETVQAAWNHQMPTLLGLAALCLLLRAGERDRARVLLGCSGICVGLATGMRLSFLPLLAPLGLAIFFLPAHSVREKWLGALSFSGGALLALAPCIWLAAQAPEAAYFANFGYPKLSLLWRKHPFWSDHLDKVVDPVRGYFGHGKNDFRGRDLGEKIALGFDQVFRSNWQLFAAWLLVGAGPTVGALWRSRGRNFPALLLLLSLPFFLWGSLAPSRIHPQYWYAPIPLLALMISFGAAQLRSRSALAASGLVIGCILAFILNAREILPAFKMGGPEWPPNQTRIITDRLKTTIDHGPVLTIESGLVTMADLEIYPEFAPGEFGWRSAHLLPRYRREMLHLICPYDLDRLLAARPPAAIFLRLDPNAKNGSLTASERNAPFVKWALEHGFTRQNFLGAFEIWLPSPPNYGR